MRIWNAINKYMRDAYSIDIQELIMFPQTFGNTAGLADDTGTVSGQAFTDYMVIVAKTPVGYLVSQCSLIQSDTF